MECFAVHAINKFLLSLCWMKKKYLCLILHTLVGFYRQYLMHDGSSEIIGSEYTSHKERQTMHWHDMVVGVTYQNAVAAVIYHQLMLITP